jgi:hypothetical protein
MHNAMNPKMVSKRHLKLMLIKHLGGYKLD